MRFYHILLFYCYLSAFDSVSRHNLKSRNFFLDVSLRFRYTSHLRPGGGTADTSVSKTDAARCAGSNPAPGTISFYSPNNVNTYPHLRFSAHARAKMPRSHARAAWAKAPGSGNPRVRGRGLGEDVRLGQS